MPQPKARPPRPLVAEPSVLVLHEKHGEVYFHVPDEESLLRAALLVVKGRLKDGHWYYDPSNDAPKGPGMTKEQVAALPDGPIKADAEKRVAAHTSALRAWYSDVEGWKRVREAVDKDDGRAAWQVLRDYSDGEYQRVSLERYCEKYR
jgi:hypothetical protein